MKTPSPAEYGPRITLLKSSSEPVPMLAPGMDYGGVKTRSGEINGTYWNELSLRKFTAETARMGGPPPGSGYSGHAWPLTVSPAILVRVL